MNRRFFAGFGTVFKISAAILTGIAFVPPAAEAAFVPADNQILDSLKGKWKIDERPGPNQIPVLTFISGANELSFTPEKSPMDWENSNKVIYIPRVQANVVLNRTYLDCPGNPLKLWFDSGEFFEMGKNSCSESKLYATARTGDRVEDRIRENHLAQMLSAHSVVAVSQDKKAVLLEVMEEEAVKRFQADASVEPNSAFYKMMRKKWAEDLKRGY